MRTPLSVIAWTTALMSWVSAASYGQCPITYYPTGRFPVGTSPYTLEAADFNSDGVLDLVVANTDSNNVSVLMGMGLGTFGAATNIGVGSHPYSLTVGDLNNDGRPDIAVGNVDSSSISILIGTGTGTFGIGSSVPLSSNPRTITSADFNGDGKLDLATANFSLSSSVGSVSIARGTGLGTFSYTSSIELGVNTRCLTAADFNEDGNADLAVGDGDNQNLYILLGTGTGSFGAPTTYLAGRQLFSVLAADFNNDGNVDIATVNITTRDVSILLGTGTGAFGTATSYPVGNSPIFAVARDLDGDGQLDIAVTNSGSNSISILPGTGTGTFGAITSYAVGTSPYSLAAGDLTGDGRLDLAVANNGSNNVSILVAFRASSLPAISLQPEAQSVIAGAAASFSVSATSPTAFTFQWQRNGVDLTNDGVVSGATTSTVSFSSAALSDNGSALTCVVTNSCGSTVSNPAGLAVLDACQVDFNHDGNIDFFDYLDFVDAISIGC